MIAEYKDFKIVTTTKIGRLTPVGNGWSISRVDGDESEVYHLSKKIDPEQIKKLRNHPVIGYLESDEYCSSPYRIVKVEELPVKEVIKKAPTFLQKLRRLCLWKTA